MMSSMFARIKTIGNMLMVSIYGPVAIFDYVSRRRGPLEKALVFLCHSQDSNEEGESQMFTRHHHRLRLCFKEFVKRLILLYT